MTLTGTQGMTDYGTRGQVRNLVSTRVLMDYFTRIEADTPKREMLDEKWVWHCLEGKNEDRKVLF